MISNKKITVISAVLVVISLAAIVFFMIFPFKNTADNITGTVKYAANHSVAYTKDDYYTDYSENSISKITLSDSGTSANSESVTVENSNITITAGGTYIISGTLSAGQLVVDSADDTPVRLVLNGASITSADGAAVYVKQAEKTVISLVKNTENTLADSANYSAAMLEDGVNAVLCSKDDLTINGEGSLKINASYKDGIKANDGFKMTEGSLWINAPDDGINANDYLAALNVNINITSGGDGVKCENESSDFGFVAMSGTNLNLESYGDGVCASSAIYMTDATAKIKTGGGSETVTLENTPGFGEGNSQDYDETGSTSAKAVKAGQNIVIKGGNAVLDSSDDTIHSDKDLSIEGGTFELSSGDDAIHAEKNANLNPEKIDITKCFEGIEAGYVVIDGGDINIVSADDAINAVGENTDSGYGMPMMMHKEDITDEDIYLTVNGGNVYIECGGDGVDSNGAAVINGGTVTVYGPENNGNSSLDFQYGFIINSGKVLAAGSQGMAELPSENSKQNSLVFYFNKSYDAGSNICLKDESGNEIISGISTKKFDWICISTPDIKKTGKYTVTADDEEAAALEVTGTVTSNNGIGRGGMRGQRPDGEMPPMPTGEMPQNGMRPPIGNMDLQNEAEDRMISSDGGRGQRMPGNFPGNMQGGFMGETAEQTQENAKDTVQGEFSIKAFIKSYQTPIISIVVLLAGFVFVILYKRKTF